MPSDETHIRVPIAAYLAGQRYPATARDLYVGLRGLLYRKTGGYERDLETSSEEIVDALQLPRRTLWRHLAAAEGCGLLKRLDGNGATAPLTIRFLRPWNCGQGAPCAKSGTPSPDIPPADPSTGDPDPPTGQPDPSAPPPGASTGDDPTQVSSATSGTCAICGTLLKDLGGGVNPDPEEENHQQFLECAKSGTAEVLCAICGTLSAYLDNNDVVRELSECLTLAQVQRGIVLMEREARANQRMDNPKGVLVTRWRQGRYADATEIPAEDWTAYERAGYRDMTGRLRPYIDN